MANNLRVIIDDGGLRCFEEPVDQVEAFDAPGADRALERAQVWLGDGLWIAGYLAYDLGEAYAGFAPRGSGALLALGAYRAPRPLDEAQAGATLSPLPCDAQPESYGAALDAIRAAIYEGAVYQVNHTVSFHAHLHGDPFAFWRRVGLQTAARYQAYVEHGARALLSWSPELFLRFERERLETCPMKGTAPLHRIEELGNAKNMAEHVMIVDLLRNDLRRVCDGVTVDALARVERYPTFATMTSTVSGTLRAGASLREIVRAAFPCGSITGAPKLAAMAQIAQRERGPRGVYCGSIGFLSPQRIGWWNVAIRTAQVDRRDGSLRFDAGGGIVADSRSDDEWAEVQLKAAFLRRAAAPVELLETLASDAGDATIALHAARLLATARRFGIAGGDDAIARLREAARIGPGYLLRLRLRASGETSVRTEPLRLPELPVRVCLAQARVRSDDPLLEWKTSYRPAHDRAAEEARARGCFDALLTNERGELTEGARTNLFVEVDGELRTPQRSCGLLPGILRHRLVIEGRARECVLSSADLVRSSRIFVGNSARGLMPAHLIESQQ